jgi:phage shock protein E
MFRSLLNLFGFGTKIDFAQLKKDGAIILDVRTKSEYERGHISQSINIAVDQLPSNLNRLGNNKEITIITCCASGMRSGVAKKILLSNGYQQVHNGGSWQSLQSKL